MKKSERHQIKRDELVTAIEKGTFYVESHARRVGILVVGGIVLAAVVFGAWTWWTGREEKASFLLGQVIQTYRAPVTTSLDTLQPTAPATRTFASGEAKDQEVVKLADEILARYGSSRAAPKALYYKGLSLTGL
jgi:hypothetical protein